MHFCALSPFSSENNTLYFKSHHCLVVVLLGVLISKGSKLFICFIVNFGFYFPTCFSMSVLIITYCISAFPYGIFFPLFLRNVSRIPFCEFVVVGNTQLLLILVCVSSCVLQFWIKHVVPY